ncbi:MAG TPA: IS1595 family transposase, partial [Dyella sp.]|nr:IS1595 family transposase [Dyella sp.]
PPARVSWMAQHFLHSKESRNFARQINRLTEDEAEQRFAAARWGAADMQGCPACGLLRKHYRRPKRRRWRCASCAHEFSATSSTPFHGRKLSYIDMIHLLVAFENGAKGQSLLETSRRVGCTPKTVQVFFGKIREWMVNVMDLRPLGGTVHMDGGYFCGKPRKPNRRIKMPKDALKVRFGKKAPKDSSRPWIEAGMTRQNWEKRANKRVVISLCESAGERIGSGRTMAFVCKAENEAEVKRLVERFVRSDSRVMTDESGAYSIVSAFVDEHYQVCHAHEFCTPEGVSDNMCETFFSRFRRSEYGTLHGFRPKYLQDFTCEFVWRENHRKHAQDDRFRLIITGLMTSGISRWWAGYWQGRHREGELGLDYFLSGRHN